MTATSPAVGGPALRRARGDVAGLLVVHAIIWMGTRIAAVALPLAALQETGEPWTTGLVGGLAALPLIASPWWATGFRVWMTTGPRLALVMGVGVLGFLLVPAVIAWGSLRPWHLALAGLLTGAATALVNPAQRALMADAAGDGARAVKALAWADLVTRVTMVTGPPLAAWGLHAVGLRSLLWAEAGAWALGAGILCTLVRHPDATLTHPEASPASPTPTTTPTPTTGPTRAPTSDGATPPEAHDGPQPQERRDDTTIRSVLRAHPDLAVAMALNALGGLVWFSFTLGLTIHGEQTGRGAELVAAGLGGYGAGSIVGALAAPRLLVRVRTLPLCALAWSVLGIGFAVMGLVIDSVPALVVTAALAALVMPLAVGGLTTLITTRTSGDARRIAFGAQSVVSGGAIAAGTALGGAVIGLFGATPVLLLAGALQLAAGISAGLWAARHSA